MKSKGLEIENKEFTHEAKNKEVVIDNNGIVDEIKIMVSFYILLSFLLLIIFWKAMILLVISTVMFAFIISLRNMVLNKNIPRIIYYKEQSFDIVMNDNSRLNIKLSSIIKIFPMQLFLKKTWFYVEFNPIKYLDRNIETIIVNHECGKELMNRKYLKSTKFESNTIINKCNIIGWPSKVHNEIYIKLIKSKQIGLRVVIIQSAIVLLLLTISGYHYLVENIDLFITFLSVASFVSILLILSFIHYRRVIFEISIFPRHMYSTSSNNN